MARGALFLLMLAGLAVSTSGCGASMHAVYEADVRFEHCMALDAEAHVKPSIRRACWAEWVAFYTYGQTRDRVVHAQLRIKQLSSVSDSMAPPVDRDYAETGTAGYPQGPISTARNDMSAAGRCSSSCDGEHAICTAECGNTSCQSSCDEAQRACLRHCL